MRFKEILKKFSEMNYKMKNVRVAEWKTCVLKSVTNADELVVLKRQKSKIQTHNSTRQIFTISNRCL